MNTTEEEETEDQIRPIFQTILMPRDQIDRANELLKMTEAVGGQVLEDPDLGPSGNKLVKFAPGCRLAGTGAIELRDLEGSSSISAPGGTPVDSSWLFEASVIQPSAGLGGPFLQARIWDDEGEYKGREWIDMRGEDNKQFATSYYPAINPYGRQTRIDIVAFEDDDNLHGIFEMAKLLLVEYSIGKDIADEIGELHTALQDAGIDADTPIQKAIQAALPLQELKEKIRNAGVLEEDYRIEGGSTIYREKWVVTICSRSFNISVCLSKLPQEHGGHPVYYQFASEL